MATKLLILLCLAAVAIAKPYGGIGVGSSVVSTSHHQQHHVAVPHIGLGIGHLGGYYGGLVGYPGVVGHSISSHSVHHGVGHHGVGVGHVGGLYKGFYGGYFPGSFGIGYGLHG